MPPTLIIDGYNLIRNSPALAAIDRRDIEEGREALLSRLSEYRKVRRLPIVVVFDGMGSYHVSSKPESRLGIKIVFSRQGQTADDYIVSLAMSRNGDTVVVTSDHGIHQRLNASNCVCLTSEAFETKMDEALYEFLKGEDLSEERDDGFRRNPRKGASRRAPKKLRKRMEILKKL